MLNEKRQSPVRDFISRWDRMFPSDYRFRQKYNIPFGSQVHRESNFFDQLIDLTEEDMIVEDFARIESRAKRLEEYQKTRRPFADIVSTPEEVDNIMKNVKFVPVMDALKDKKDVGKSN